MEATGLFFINTDNKSRNELSASQNKIFNFKAKLSNCGNALKLKLLNINRNIYVEQVMTRCKIITL